MNRRSAETPLQENDDYVPGAHDTGRGRGRMGGSLTKGSRFFARLRFGHASVALDFARAGCRSAASSTNQALG